MNTQIVSFETACEALKQLATLPDVSMLPEKEQKAITAHYKLTVINRALNGDWAPNWGDYNENKYYPWFDMEPGGFSFCDSDSYCTHSFVGSRLCFRSRELAEYAGETFTDLYRDYFVIE